MSYDDILVQYDSDVEKNKPVYIFKKLFQIP